jgi:hypothetical protein
MKTLHRILAVAGLMGAAALPLAAGLGQPTLPVSAAAMSTAERRAMRRERSGSSATTYPRRTPVWTNARYKRAAVKSRNQQRNRDAHR